MGSIIIKPNTVYGHTNKINSIFLAGTIDNGQSEDWQSEVAKYLEDTDVMIFNPRRDDWNDNASEAEQYAQIDWEQRHLDKADLICMVLKSNSKSPISLLELGQYSNSGKLIVFCPKEFYRYHNVSYVCQKQMIPLVNTEDPKEIAEQIKMLLSTITM